jgi:multisubunit Na+/H+ antiporter MnhG subunit
MYPFHLLRLSLSSLGGLGMIFYPIVYRKAEIPRRCTSLGMTIIVLAVILSDNEACLPVYPPEEGRQASLRSQ